MKHVFLLIILSMTSCIGQTKNRDLLQLVDEGNIEGVKALLTPKNVNHTSKRKESLLMIASYNNNLEMAKLLVSYGADPNQQDINLNSPFLYTGNNGNVQMAELFVLNGARFDVFNRFGGTALIPAAERGHIGIVKFLSKIEHFPINHVNKLGWTALMEAVVLGNGGNDYIEIVRILLESGADKNIPDKDGVSAYQHAKKRGFSEMEKLLK